MKNCFIGRTRKQIRQRYIIIIKKKKISENIEQPISLNTTTLTDDEKTETNKIKETDSFEWNNELDKIYPLLYKFLKSAATPGWLQSFPKKGKTWPKMSLFVIVPSTSVIITFEV